MNHATISPDGRMILACGDEPRAFFCRRKELAGFAVDGDLQYARYEWQEMAEPILTIAVPWDTCFATAFSSSGHICAVASQAGTIIIFDTSLVRDDMEADEAVVKVLKSSRPCLDSDDVRGAVRSMAFSPEPWDLFAWAEHHGRVCVTDLRDSFHSRQTIEVDVQDPDLHRIEPIDEDEKFSTVQQRELQIERLFLQRHQDSLNTQDTSSVVHDVTNYMELAAERRRMQRNLRDSGAVDSIYSGPSGLTEEERQMLESLRTERQEQTNRETEARAVAERASGAHSLAPIGSGSSTRNRDVNSSTHNLSSAPSMSRSISIHQYLRERNSERRGTAEPRAHQPRVRRSSVALSTSNPSNSSRLSTGSTNAAATTTLVGTSYRPNHSIRDYSSSFHDPPALEDPWHTISAAMANHTGPPGSQPIHRELDRELQRQRDRYHERERERQRDRDAVEVSFTTFERRIQQSARSERQRDTRLRQVQTQIRNEDAGYGEYELDVLRRMEGERGRGRGIGEDGDGSGAGAGVGMMGIQWSSDGRLLYVLFPPFFSLSLRVMSQVADSVSLLGTSEPKRAYWSTESISPIGKSFLPRLSADAPCLFFSLPLFRLAMAELS